MNITENLRVFYISLRPDHAARLELLGLRLRTVDVTDDAVADAFPAALNAKLAEDGLALVGVKFFFGAVNSAATKAKRKRVYLRRRRSQ